MIRSSIYSESEESVATRCISRGEDTRPIRIARLRIMKQSRSENSGGRSPIGWSTLTPLENGSARAEPSDFRILTPFGQNGTEQLQQTESQYGKAGAAECRAGSAACFTRFSMEGSSSIFTVFVRHLLVFVGRSVTTLRSASSSRRAQSVIRWRPRGAYSAPA